MSTDITQQLNTDISHPTHTLEDHSNHSNESNESNESNSTINDNLTSLPSIIDLFILFDIDNDGYISENELYNGLLESLGNEDLVKQIMICFNEIYKTSNNHIDNSISLDEFKLAFTLFQELGGSISMSPINEDEWEEENEEDNNNGIVNFNDNNTIDDSTNDNDVKSIPKLGLKSISRSPVFNQVEGELSSRSNNGGLNKPLARLATISIEQQANKDLSEQIQLLNRNLKKSQEREKLWREQVSSFETEIVDLKKENESLKNQLRDSNNKNSNLVSNNAKQVEHIASLEEQLRSSADKLMASNQKCTNIQSRLDTETKLLDESKSNVEFLNNDNFQLEQIIKQLESKVESLNSTINSLNSTLNHLVEENNSLEKANLELKTNAAAAETEEVNSENLSSPEKRKNSNTIKSPAGFVPAPKTIVPQHAFPKRDESRRLEVLKPGMGSMLTDMFGIFVSVPEAK